MESLWLPIAEHKTEIQICSWAELMALKFTRKERQGSVLFVQHEPYTRHMEHKKVARWTNIYVYSEKEDKNSHKAQWLNV